MAEQKVFGVGLARTGTTSLHEAMGLLGIRSAPNSAALLDDLNHSILTEYDAFFDNPIPFLYRELDEAWPDALFIATTRPHDDWLRSMRWLFSEGLDRLNPDDRRLGDRVHQAVYGITEFDEQTLSRIWHDHHHGLREWFGDRDDILWLELGKGGGWVQLCPFLGCDIPNSPFPHSNPARARSKLRRLSALLPRR